MLEKIIEKIYFPIFILLGGLIGLTSTNILHFAIEDHFDTNIISNFLFNYEYALSLSILIVSSVFFIILSLVLLKLDKKTYILTNAKKNFLIFLLVVSALVIFIYICLVVYSFFAGRSEPYGLLRIAVTFFMIIFGAISLSLRLNNEGIFFNKKIFLYDTVLISILLLSSIYLTLKFAPPSFIKSIIQDREKVNNVEYLANKVNIFYINNKILPQNIDTLLMKGHLKDKNIKVEDYKLTPKDQANYTICTNFSHDSDDHKRYRKRYGAQSNLVYKKGLYCFNYEIRKLEKDYKNLLISGHLKIEK
jgi:competence protein ComGC